MIVAWSTPPQGDSRPVRATDVDGQASSVVRRSGGFVLAPDLPRLLAAPGWPAVSILCSARRPEWPSPGAEAQPRPGPVVAGTRSPALPAGPRADARPPHP